MEHLKDLCAQTSLKNWWKRQSLTTLFVGYFSPPKRTSYNTSNPVHTLCRKDQPHSIRRASGYLQSCVSKTDSAEVPPWSACTRERICERTSMDTSLIKTADFRDSCGERTNYWPYRPNEVIWNWITTNWIIREHGTCSSCYSWTI